MMNTIEIILIVIGILVIIISCILVDRSQEDRQQLIGKSLSSLEEKLTEEDKKQLTDKINELLQEAAEEAVEHTDDALSKISNEKIMAMNEFSDQILEKIKHNHEEVVFLYNMLNNKEKELKATVRDIDTSKKLVQNMLEGKSELDSTRSQRKANLQTAAAAEDRENHPRIRKAEPAGNQTEMVQDAGKGEAGQGNNERILALYAQGMTVMEISRQLELGQGEVKLVIDLYQEKK